MLWAPAQKKDDHKYNDFDPGLIRQIDSIIETARTELHVSGVSIAIMHKDKIILAKGYGLADREKGVLSSAFTIYPIASISKQFTAAAIMKLIEQGMLRLDEPVTTYIPEYHNKQTPLVSIRQLLNQTSGIPEWDNLPEFQDMYAGNAADYSLAKLIEVLGKLEQLYPAGEWWSYSNSNYSLLASVIEHVTGKTYEQYMGETIFSPLRLLHTGSCQPNQNLPSGLHAVGYMTSKDSFMVAELTDNEARLSTGCGGICSNATDLVSWMHALVNGRVVRDRSYRQMITTSRVRAGFIPPYGFGLSVVPIAEQPATWHMGVSDQSVSELAYLPRQDLTIAVLTNASHIPLQIVVNKIVRAILKSPEPKIYDLAIGKKEIDRSVGNYDDAMFKFNIYTDSGRLYMHVPGLNATYRLRYQGGHEYVTDHRGKFRLKFESSTGVAERVDWDWGEIRAYGRRIE